MKTLSILLVLQAIIQSALLIAVWWNLHRLRKVAHQSCSAFLPDEIPFISVIIPARNEEDEIGDLLDDLQVQDYPRFEVIVVDDCSSDRTADIVRERMTRLPRLKLVSGTPKPPEWMGKCHAMNQGMKASEGDWLLFLDCDMRLAPDGLSRSVRAAATHRADLYSLMPRLECVSFWERLLMPVFFGLIFLKFRPARVNHPRSRTAAALGGFLLFRRKSLEAIGGLDSVRGEMVEDLALARRIKAHGLQLVLDDGTRFASSRMYRNLSDIWQGFAKNAFSALDFSAVKLLMLIAGLSYLLLFPFSALVLLLLLTGLSFITWLAGISCLLVLLSRAQTDSIQGYPRRYILLHPVGILLVISLLVTSAWQVTFGAGVQWKGRRYFGKGNDRTG